VAWDKNRSWGVLPHAPDEQVPRAVLSAEAKVEPGALRNGRSKAAGAMDGRRAMHFAFTNGTAE
jgi:hypothetical protein